MTCISPDRLRAAPLAVMSVQLLEAGQVVRSQDRRKGLAVRHSDLFMPRRMEFKGWGTDYTQCRYQGRTDTEGSNLINDLYKMVPDAQNSMLTGIKQERTRNVANQNYGKLLVQQRGQSADMN